MWHKNIAGRFFGWRQMMAFNELQQVRGPRYTEELEMWANAQRDGRPAEYGWRPLFNAAKFG